MYCIPFCASGVLRVSNLDGNMDGILLVTATPLARRTCHHDHCRTQLRPRVEAVCVWEGVVVPFDWFSDWENDD